MDQLETCRLVDCPCSGQDVVGPKRHALISQFASVPDAGLHEAAPDALAAHVGLDIEKSELGNGLGFSDQKHRTNAATIDVCDPRAFARGVEILDKFASNLRHHGLEGMVPTVLLRIEHGMPMYDPADVTGR